MAFYDEYDIIQLKDKDGKALMPRTSDSLVYSDDGTALTTRIDEIDANIDTKQDKMSTESIDIDFSKYFV